ncbi:MAG: adenylate/guanylate cyclase domain-containing protein [Chloroflexi bacterium]|nr:adenylate/guanylate cyclase domain-containing protein [Chloroflexota bacterium]MDA1174384.1 adenylate/guanylate cyclase domain-containing protein [Chloroflexota bacterium]
MYAVVYGFSLVTALPLFFVLVVGASILLSHLTRKHKIAVYAQISSIMLVTAAIQWTIGGMFDSRVVLLWAFIGPLVALMFLSFRAAGFWIIVYLLLVISTVLFDGYLSSQADPSSDALRRFYFGLNLGIASLVVFAFAGYFVTSTLRERALANQLLLSVLPPSIAERLKRDSGLVADSYASASILFADGVGSTPLFAQFQPTEVVDWLNEVFTSFDEVVERHGLEKLRTIGDGYMVGSGVPVAREDHAPALVACALDLIQASANIPARNGQRLEFRFGINSGPVVAGIVGTSKFHYDLWGDAVNVASRMESTGEVGKVHISQSTFDLVEADFTCTSRGVIPVKGKGEMQTWFVEGRRQV